MVCPYVWQFSIVNSYFVEFYLLDEQVTWREGGLPLLRARAVTNLGLLRTPRSQLAVGALGSAPLPPTHHASWKVQGLISAPGC